MQPEKKTPNPVAEIKDYWSERMDRIKSGNPCQHEDYYIAVRHESGLKLRACRTCGARF
jgi:hypothetical protein